MAKRKTMTKAQKAMNAKIKKELQEKGIVPPDKPRLNRKKYIEEAREEWNGRDAEYYAHLDEDGDVAAFSNFLAKGKDETEVTFTIEDNY